MCLVPGLLVVTVVRLLLRVDCQAPPPTGKQEFLKIDRLRQRAPITKAARPPRQGSQPAFAASRRRARPAAFQIASANNALNSRDSHDVALVTQRSESSLRTPASFLVIHLLSVGFARRDFASTRRAWRSAAA